MAWSAVSVTMSLLVGLAITRILTGLVAIFRARARAELDWVPMAWAVVLLLNLLEAWMALNELPALEPVFSFPEYLGLGAMMMLLFASAALLLPPGELAAGDSLRTSFAEEGRFALPAYSLFLVFGAVANVRFFGVEIMALWFALDIPLILLPLAVFAARRRRIVEILTATYLPLYIADIYVSIVS